MTRESILCRPCSFARKTINPSGGRIWTIPLLDFWHVKVKLPSPRFQRPLEGAGRADFGLSMSEQNTCFPAFNTWCPRIRSEPTTPSLDVAGIAGDTAA